MAQSQAELVKALVDAGVHFGHRVSRWNPKMEPYIHGKRNMIHIIDVRETIKGLLRARKLVQNMVAGGKDVLFVGTKRQARHAVEEESRRCGMHYVSERWLGGTLTNFRTIRARLNRLEELEKLFTTGQIETYSKKMKATLQREMEKIKANLEGIRRMERMPGVMFIIDTRREHIAVKEARKLGVPTIALIDTDSDPDLIDLPIPANDDAMRAIEIILREMADAVIEGKQGRTDKTDGGDGAAGPGPGPRGPRRSSRTAFRADEGRGVAAAAGTEGAGDDVGPQAEIPPPGGGPAENVPTPEAVGAGQTE
ncbi:MAG TPA: 30S ribosomal protein S2 [Tepidisphaeraceae bacterium]|nr:30S ribosomal protein S2 [Tepidisphaeraceae bacterium]